jgi:FAD synthase
VITFRKNPKKYAFTNKKTTKFDETSAGTFTDIIDFEEKIKLLNDFGIALCVIIDFSEHFSKISGRDFLEALRRHLCPAYIGLGENFHCGYRRDTDAETFKALALDMGIEAEIVLPVMEGGLAVSSSRIRKALEVHNYEEVSLLLGRPYKTRVI